MAGIKIWIWRKVLVLKDEVVYQPRTSSIKDISAE